MRKTAFYLLSAVATLLLAACTRNHGDIGIWFGTWHVRSITADGSPVPVEGDFFFQFQNRVFRVSKVSGHEDVVESYGTWSESDDGHTMTVAFPDSSTYYIKMPGLEAHNAFTVTASTSRRVTLTKADTTGTTYCYHLIKQN